MWGDLLDWIGTATESVLAPVASVLEPAADEAAWGWAVLLLGAAWRILTWPWLVSGARRRIDRQRGSEPDPDGGPGTFGRIGTAFGLAQFLLVVVIALWSRTGPSAEDAAFYGLETLSSPPVTQGLGGLAWAAALAVAGTAAGLLGQRAAGVDDQRQRFFARYIAPVVFACLGLFLPAAMVVPFAAAMALNAAAVRAAARGDRGPVEAAA